MSQPPWRQLKRYGDERGKKRFGKLLSGFFEGVVGETGGNVSKTATGKMMGIQ